MLATSPIANYGTLQRPFGFWGVGMPTCLPPTGCTTISRNRVSNGCTLLMFTTEVTCLNLTMPLFKLSESSKLARCPLQRIVSVPLKSIFAKRRGASFELQKDCLKNPHGRRGFAVSCRESLRLYISIAVCQRPLCGQIPSKRVPHRPSSYMLANSGHVLCFCKCYRHGPSFPPE